MTKPETQTENAACPEKQSAPLGSRRMPGVQVRTELQAGAWRCTSCSGETVGNQLFKPTCSYCEAY
jgi:hypothetical protein